MGKAEDNKATFDTAQSAHKSNPLPRIGRMIVCVLTMGMAFPNAFSESVDIADYEVRNSKTQK
ncbi:MAG: hypothetical protein EBT83_17160 [Betaproteobacteria bacterium]|jgi:hypothetical protein|nr:hypothetical protein [Betaproteobacteria bacterium]